jgi:hypothetical protein
MERAIGRRDISMLSDMIERSNGDMRRYDKVVR